MNQAGNLNFLPFSYDEVLNACILKYIYCVSEDGNINENDILDNEYFVNTCFTNSMILFFYLILHDKKPSQIKLAKLENNKNFECPLIFIPLFENNNVCYYYPISTETKEEISKQFGKKINNRKISTIERDIIDIGQSIYEYPILQNLQNLKGGSEKIDIGKIALSLINSIRSPQKTKSFNLAIHFLGYSLGILQNIYEISENEFNKQIKYLYFYMFIFFFDDISTIYSSGLINKFLNEYIPVLNKCFNVEIDFNSNNTIDSIFFEIHSYLDKEENNFFHGFEHIFKKVAPKMFSLEEGFRESYELFLYRFERSYRAYQEYKK